MAYLTDIEIAQACKMRPIREIGEKAHVPEELLEPYGKYKAKVDLSLLKKDRKDGKLVLVTAITPTPAGEGKTTTTIGLADGLRRIGKEAVVALREPSLGPVFGVKGGRRRICPGCAHGGHQPAFHRGFSCNRCGEQSAGRNAG